MLRTTTSFKRNLYQSVGFSFSYTQKKRKKFTAKHLYNLCKPIKMYVRVDCGCGIHNWRAIFLRMMYRELWSLCQRDRYIEGNVLYDLAFDADKNIHTF